jgi:Flp pilus assembly pilin Flp
MAEYTLVLTLIAAAIITAVAALSEEIRRLIQVAADLLG